MQQQAGFQLSAQQKYLWQTYFHSAVQAAEVVVQVEGHLDVERLKRALQQVVERHEILRTTFSKVAGMKFPFQVIQAPSSVDLAQLELGPGMGLEDEEQTERILAASGRPDLDTSPALKASLLSLSPVHHALVLRLPALCADSRSLDNLVEEIRGLYADSSSSIPDPLQYADYAQWQDELSQKDDEEVVNAKKLWAAQDYASIPQPVLRMQRRREAASPHISESVPVTVDGSAVKKACDSASWDASDLLLACWQVLLSRLAGQTEIVVGFVSEGRSQEELQAALGVFARPLPLVANFGRDYRIEEVIERVRRSREEAVRWEDYFLLESMEPLAVGFFAESAPGKSEISDVTFTVSSKGTASFGFGMELHAVAGHNGLFADVRYDPAFFDRDVATKLAQRYSMLVAAALADPKSRISSLPILDEQERQLILVEFNRTSAGYPSKKCIHHLFEDQASLTPDRLALRFRENEFSFRELNNLANQIAHFLRKRGVQAGVPVGLCMERSAEMIIGLLGILKAGGCYVPLVPDSPKARLAHQLAETGVPVVLTHEAIAPNLPESKAEIVCVDRDHEVFASESELNPAWNTSPEDLVYVIYTSGSTGTPKGVAVRHFNLVNYSSFIMRRLGLDKHPEALNFATVSTIAADLGNTCIFPSLISGGCLHVIDYETAVTPDRFAQYVSEHPIDVLKITPSHLASLVHAAEGRILPRRYLVLGGESSSWSLVQRVQELGNCEVINHYGPTEATVGCCTFAVKENDVRAWGPVTVPIGRPIANDEVYILDQQLQPVPVGVPGELCVGGVGLAAGYLNQPEQTAERFIAHPFSKNGSARLYRTGDLARFLPDGNIEFMGRIDQQVKIRGFRVEPAEVEVVLKRHPVVKQAAIVAFDDKLGEKRLAAYVVGNKEIKADDLRPYLLQHLPEYMVPSALITVNEIPLTRNGKVDTRALPSPEQEPSRTHSEFLEPRNPDEEKLVGIWREVLKLERVSIKDNFFELGGHSLLATQIIARIRSAFRVQLPLSAFLEAPTIDELAGKLGQYPQVESEQEELARLLRELEGISEEEAERLLAEQGGAVGDTGGNS